jgi:hypothetical protein
VEEEEEGGRLWEKSEYAEGVSTMLRLEEKEKKKGGRRRSTFLPTSVNREEGRKNRGKVKSDRGRQGRQR